MKELVLATALAFALAACAPPPPQTAAACPAPLKSALQFNLYFGRETANGGQVSEAEWAKFLADEVTPRFPDGLSVIDVAGQSRESSGRMAREKTKLLVVVVFDAPAHLPKVQAVVDAYNKRYGQHGVFRTEHSVCAGV
jgi:hypothetical protein